MCFLCIHIVLYWYISSSNPSRIFKDGNSQIRTNTESQSVEKTARPECSSAPTLKQVKLRLMRSSKQKVDLRQLLQSREKSAPERLLPELSGKSFSNGDNVKFDDQKAHCEFHEQKLASSTASVSLPNVDASQYAHRNEPVKYSKPCQTPVNVTGSRESEDHSFAVAEDTACTEKLYPLLVPTRLRSLETMDPVIRDNINDVMINFIQQARFDIEKSKENRKKLETELSQNKSRSLSVKKIEKCVDITMRPRAPISEAQRHGEIKGRLIKSR